MILSLAKRDVSITARLSFKRLCFVGSFNGIRGGLFVDADKMVNEEMEHCSTHYAIVHGQNIVVQIISFMII
jgi:hypothetical protein